MKLKLLLASLLLSGSLLAQTTNAPPPFLSSPIVDFLSHSNLLFATYGIYDNTSHKAGGGLALGYHLSDFVVTTLRLDYINNAVWNPSASLQLQVPITVLGKFQATPFVFDGIATPINGMGRRNFDPENIVGVGAAFSIGKNKSAWIPRGIVIDYEKWSGGGFNDNQIRAGAYWKF